MLLRLLTIIRVIIRLEHDAERELHGVSGKEVGGVIKSWAFLLMKNQINKKEVSLQKDK